MQIMPSIFDKIEELELVDWETIVIYTCANPQCIPKVDQDNFYSEEYAFIQFSDDFINVKYGDKQQIAEQKIRKKKEMEEEMKQQELQKDEIIKEQNEVKEEIEKSEPTSKNKKKKNKKDKKQA